MCVGRGGTFEQSRRYTVMKIDQLEVLALNSPSRVVPIHIADVVTNLRVDPNSDEDFYGYNLTRITLDQNKAL